MTPFGIYDTKQHRLAYIGLHANERDVWTIYLGWPDQSEIEEAKAKGLRCVSLTVTYDGGEPRS